MNLRIKATIITILFLLVFMILQFFDLSNALPINQEIAKALIVTLFYYLGLYFVLGFNVKGVRFMTVLGYSSFIVFIQTLFLELIVFQNVGRISEKTFSIAILFLFGLSIHFLILSTNILNVSYIAQIPLGQAAKASNFMYTLFCAYFAFLLILKVGAVEPLRFLMFLFVVSFLTLNIFWFKKESVRQLLGEGSAVIAFMATIYIVFALWPLSSEVTTMFYTVVYYILLGLGLEERETTSTVMRIEYAVLFLIAVFLILKLAIWGINGTII